MKAELNTIRLLGTAQLIVIIGNLIMDTLLSSAIGSGTISDTLLNISNNITETMAVSKIATNALIPLSQEFVKAGTPESSNYQTLFVIQEGVRK